MKKILLVIMLFIGMNTQAQEVFNELRQKNKAIVENQQSAGIVRAISQFKLDALNYLVIKMQEEMPDSSVYFLDRQALAMDDFVQFYIKKLVQYNEMPQALQQEMTKMFMEASKDHPLFKDKDRRWCWLTITAERHCCASHLTLTGRRLLPISRRKWKKTNSIYPIKFSYYGKNMEMVWQEG